MKHRLKLWLREVWARFLFHTGLSRWVDRLMPPRLVILAGHCVAPAEGNGFLPGDMKIGVERLERILRWLARRHRMVTVAEGVEALDRGTARRGLVALSMDDGYRDNHDVMMPLLERLGVPATVYLVSSLCDGGRLDWSHKYSWILRKLSPPELVARYQAASGDPLSQLRQRGGDLTYHFKRHLKYEADPAQRDAALDRIFRELGGDEAAVARALLMDWDQARALQERGFELGCHTVGHPVLARLGRAEARREMALARERMEAELGAGRVRSFAYPFGRRWDYSDETRELVRELGFCSAVNTHAGCNGADSDRSELARLMIDENAALHLIAAEACGGFELLRRFGLNLSE